MRYTCTRSTRWIATAVPSNLSWHILCACVCVNVSYFASGIGAGNIISYRVKLIVSQGIYIAARKPHVRACQGTALEKKVTALPSSRAIK